MGHHDIGITGIIGSIAITIFVTIPHKIASVLLQTTTYINPDAKQFIMDLSPFLGAITAIIAIIMYLYKIKVYKKQLKMMDKDKDFTKSKEMD